MIHSGPRPPPLTNVEYLTLAKNVSTKLEAGAGPVVADTSVVVSDCIRSTTSAQASWNLDTSRSRRDYLKCR
ncbi:uncharacterized protein F4812DRAFT_423053 [Daldinia caldariorum]|uniref:uncharacterized protein n=1 Tax=Daldinia caldariorum TaxID=326644 RepID=UPI00200829AA|nr:uncharacterized protein F4812DRAFT_423053 [Daldinia caldariorum]KAI1469444.1 hypothetical protein F4812DRAFT_423053 [Daldinia caldariorum]